MAVVFMCCVIGPCCQHYVQLISIVFRIRWESFRVLSVFQPESKGQFGRAPNQLRSALPPALSSAPLPAAPARKKSVWWRFLLLQLLLLRSHLTPSSESNSFSRKSTLSGSESNSLSHESTWLGSKSSSSSPKSKLPGNKL